MTENKTIAEEIGEKIKEISIAEFFEKNRHLLGYENPTKSLLTVVKEFVDNSLDACLEARILPNIKVSIKEVKENIFKVIVEDNGPGLPPDKIPIAFGKFLVGSKFMRLRQSVWKNEILPIMVDEKIEFVKIGEFIDRFIKNDEGNVNLYDKNIKVLSYNPKNLKVEWSKVSNLIKHVNDEELYEIEMECGKRIRITSSHSIFVARKDGIYSIPTSEIKKGDYIVVCRKFTMPFEIEELNLLKVDNKNFFRKNKCFLENVGRKVFDKIKSCEKIENRKKTYYIIGSKKVRDEYIDLLERNNRVDFWIVKELGIEKFVDKNAYMVVYNKKKKIIFPVYVSNLNDFACILGWFISRGDIKYDQVIFSFEKLEEDIVYQLKEKIEKVFWVKGKIKKDKNKIELKFSSPILSKFLVGTIGKSIKNRKIPYFVYYFDKISKFLFVNSLLKAQAYVNKKKSFILYTTPSENLVIQLYYLLLSLGVFSSISKTVKRKEDSVSITLYKILISGKEMEKFGYFKKRYKTIKTDKIPPFLLKEFLNNTIKEEINGEDLHKMVNLSFSKFQTISGSELIPSYILTNLETEVNFLRAQQLKLLELLNSDLSFLKVKNIKKIKLKKREYVYDISVPGNENFICSTGIVCHNSVGTQGIGAKGAILYSQLTTGKPAKITTYFKGKKYEIELGIDVIRNEPKIISKKEENIDKNLHGLKVEVVVEGRYIEKGQSIPNYLKYIWIANPFTKIIYEGPNSNFTLERVINELPKEPKEIKPHPYGVELGRLKRMAHMTKSRNIIGFLTTEFSRIGKDSAVSICKLAKIDINKKPNELNDEEVERLHKAMQNVKLMSPPTDCLSPLKEEYLIESLKKEFEPEFVTAIVRKPAVYRGYPFQVQVGLAYGGKICKITQETILLRFANHTPLLYNQSDCAITRAVEEVDWGNYRLPKNSKGLPPVPLVILVDLISVWIPYKSEGKQAIAEYPEIIKEVKLALQEAGRRLSLYLHKKFVKEQLAMRTNIFEAYSEIFSEFVSELTGKQKEYIKQKLLELIRKGEYKEGEEKKLKEEVIEVN